MNVLIVYAHPNPRSFNHAILEVADHELKAGGHAVRVRDLYAERFDPVLSASDLDPELLGGISPEVQREQDALAWAEALIVIYPLWWFDRPAILKGWFDRVFTNGFAFRYTEQGPVGLLKCRKALVFVTTGGSEEDLEHIARRDRVVGATTDGSLAFCGIPEVVDKVFYGVPLVNDVARARMLDEVRHLIGAL